MTIIGCPGFQSLRMIRNAASRIWAPGVAAGAVTGSLLARPGVVDQLVVELADSVIGANADAVELYDAANIDLLAAGTLVMILRPWGAATQGSYSIPIHRQFVQGIIVRTTDITQTTGMAQADVTLIFKSIGPAGRRSFVQRY